MDQNQEIQVGDCFVRKLPGTVYPTWQVSHMGGMVIAHTYTKADAHKIAELFSYKPPEESVTGLFGRLSEGLSYAYFPDNKAPNWPTNQKVKLTLLKE